MKNLHDYLPERPVRNTPVKVSESPMLSPDTLDALRRAETLVKEAQKTILEASYDVASSPERENSIRSAGNNEAEDDYALHIRDIVATRFYEANESARIFTRPSTRPLAERVCRLPTRQRRVRRFRQNFSNTTNEQSTSLRPNFVQRPTGNVRKFIDDRSNDLRDGLEKNSSSLPQRTKSDEEIPRRIVSGNASEGLRGWKIDNQNASNSFTVEQGPRVDIRNELTITNVEKVEIEPGYSFPVQRNTKTYEFRHEYPVRRNIDEPTESTEKSRSMRPAMESTEKSRSMRPPTESTEKSRSIRPATETNFVVIRESTDVAGNTSDSIRKRRGSVTTLRPTGSRPDLVENKFGRSISAERLRGHVDNACTAIEKPDDRVTDSNVKIIDADANERNIMENKENRESGFIDFLRRFKNLGNDDKNDILVGHDVFGNLGTNDKIKIFDRAIEQFLNDLGNDGSKRSPENRFSEMKIDQNIANDVAGRTENSMDDEFSGVDGFDESWNPEEINLQPPNIEALEKSLSRFGTTLDVVLRGTKNLGLMMSEYFVEAGTTKIFGSTNRRCFNDPKSADSASTENVSGEASSKNEESDERAAVDIANIGVRNAARSGDESTKSRENSDASSVGCRRRFETGRALPSKPSTMENGAIATALTHHPRFSTPLNDDSKVTRFRGLNAVCDTKEFANFFNGIQRPKDSSSSKFEPSCSSRRIDFPPIDGRIDDEIFTKNNELFRPRSVATRNDLELEKKNVLDEIEKKCNFRSLFDGRHSVRPEIAKKPRDAEIFPYDTIANERSTDAEKSETKSLIRDSAIGRTTDRSDKISVGEKPIDEDTSKNHPGKSEHFEGLKKNSAEETKSASGKNIEKFRIESVDGDKMESIGAKIPSVTNDSVESTRAIDKSEKKLSTTLRCKIIDDEKISDNDNEYSLKSGASGTLGNKNRLTASPGSSLKDRTSFDVSTVHSEDFQEPAAVVGEKSERDEKSASAKSAASKSISNRVKIAGAKEAIADCGRDDSSKSFLASSLLSKGSSDSGHESKGEKHYSDKSVSSISAIEKFGSSEKIVDDEKVSGNGLRSSEIVTREKENNGGDSGMKKKNAITPETSKNSCKDGCSGASTSASSAKGCETRSAGEILRTDVKCRKEIVVNDEMPKRSDVEGNLFLRKRDAEEFAICTNSKPDVALDKSNSIGTILTAVDDFSKSDNEVVSRISDGSIEISKSNRSDETLAIRVEKSCAKNASHEKQEWSSISRDGYSYRKRDEKSGKAGPKFAAERNEQSKNEVAQRELTKQWKRKRNTVKRRKSVTEIDSSSSKSDEFANFESSISDTCSENYSEGELYLPSSCSYSLGEVRITERGSHGSRGSIIQTSAPNPGAIKIYFEKKNSTPNLSDEGIKGSNSMVNSPGEVLGTDIESISSSQGASSEGEHRIDKRFIPQLKPFET